MPKYLIQGVYSGEGIKGILKAGGSSRRERMATLFESVGGSLEALYFAFGETDVYAIADVPDHATMAAIALTIGASGAGAVTTTVLMTPEEVDEAAKKTVHYRPPGQ